MNFRISDRSLLWTIFGLAVASGALHVNFGLSALGVPERSGVGIPFLLMALGYFVGAALIAANVRRDLWIKVAFPFVAILIVAWAPGAIMGIPPTREPPAFVDKVIEVVLLLALLTYRRRTKQAAPAPPEVASGLPVHDGN